MLELSITSSFLTMNKSLTLGLVLASSLLLSGCGQQNSNNQNTKNEDKTDTSSFSLRELIAQNIPQKCTYVGSNEEGSYTSEIIISGKKFNQTISYKSSEGEEKINSISDGEYIYTWGKHSTGGTFATKLKADFDTKTDFPEQEVPEEAIGDVSESQTDLDAKFEGDCSPTVVTDANFQPPKDVKFEDYSKFLDDLKSSIPSIDSTDLE